MFLKTKNFVFDEGPFEDRITVPVLFDKKTKRIVNNDSGQILRIFSTDFNDFSKNPQLDLYPDIHRKEIDELNELISQNINIAVYQAGSAKNQEDCDSFFFFFWNIIF